MLDSLADFRGDLLDLVLVTGGDAEALRELLEELRDDGLLKERGAVVDGGVAFALLAYFLVEVIVEGLGFIAQRVWDVLACCGDRGGRGDGEGSEEGKRELHFGKCSGCKLFYSIE